MVGLAFNSDPLGPDVSEDQSGDDETEKDSDHAIANLVKIGIGCKSLEETVEERESDLQPSIADSFAPGGDPAGDRRCTSNNHNE